MICVYLYSNLVKMLKTKSVTWVALFSFSVDMVNKSHIKSGFVKLEPVAPNSFNSKVGRSKISPILRPGLEFQVFWLMPNSANGRKAYTDWWYDDGR